MYLVYNYMLHVVMSQNVHKSSTSHVNAQMYIYSSQLFETYGCKFCTYIYVF